MSQISYEAIGTHWTIDIDDPLSSEQLKLLKKEILKISSDFDEHYSRFRNDSLISQMASKAGKYRLPSDAKPLMDLYKSLYKNSGGLLTPLIGQTLSDSGYDSNYSLKPKKSITKPSTWDETLSYNWPYLEVKKPALLDFGAAGKGYLVDLITDFLSSQGLKNFCVDGSGDIAYRSTARNTIKIGLEHPSQKGQVIGTVDLVGGQSLCASAGNRRAWDKYHHMINPKSLQSPKDILASWVIASSTMRADALATALFFVSPNILKKRYEFSYLFVKSDYTYDVDTAFEATLFQK